MKKTITLALLALLFTACNSDKQRLTENARNYLEATSAYDIDRSCQYCTPETARGLRIIEKKIMPKLDQGFIDTNSQATIKIRNVEYLNDTMAQIIFVKKTPYDHYRDTLCMLKRDGQWLAHSPFNIPPVLTQDISTMHRDTNLVLHPVKL